MKVINNYCYLALVYYMALQLTTNSFPRTFCMIFQKLVQTLSVFSSENIVLFKKFSVVVVHFFFNLNILNIKITVLKATA